MPGPWKTAKQKVRQTTKNLRARRCLFLAPFVYKHNLAKTRVKQLNRLMNLVRLPSMAQRTGAESCILLLLTVLSVIQPCCLACLEEKASQSKAPLRAFQCIYSQ